MDAPCTAASAAPLGTVEATTSRDDTAYAQRTIHHHARRLIGRYGFTDQDLPDLEQQVAADLLPYLRRFDPRRGGMRTYIARVVPQLVASLVRSRCCAMRDWRRASTRVDETAEMLIDAGTETAAERRDLRLDLAGLFPRLTAEQRTFCVLLAEHGMSEATRRLGVSRQHGYLLRAQIRAICERAGLTPDA